MAAVCFRRRRGRYRPVSFPPLRRAVSTSIEATRRVSCACVVMSRMTWLGTVALLASAGALAVSLTVAFTRPPSANADTGARPTEDRPAGDVDDVRPPNDRLRPVRGGKPLQDEARAEDESENPARRSREDGTRSREADEARIAARRSLLDARIDEERRDSWSVETEVAVRQAVTNGDLGDVSLQDVRCGSTLCRFSAELHGALDETRQAFELGTTRADPIRGRVFMHFDGGFAARNVTTYFMRDGHPMPMPAQEEEN
jgi:hypothetical protein